jgi:hypothetical protein
MLLSAGFTIDKISNGWWSKNEDGWTFQDAILAGKPG